MTMEITFPGNKRVNSTYNGFTFPTDQPKKEGGDGSAPQPFDLFLASIGTCAGIYVLNFCEKRRIPGENIKITLDFHRNKRSHMIEAVDIIISLPPDFPAKYKKAVIKAAGLCAVKKHLETPPQFNIKTALSTEAR